MTQTIVIASADEYMKQIERNSPFPKENSTKEIFVDNDIPSLNEATSDFIQTSQLTEEEIELPKPGSRNEYPETHNTIRITSKNSQKQNKGNKKSTGRRLQLASNTQNAKDIYTIQVGAFQSQNHAKSLIKRLKGRGHNSFIAMARIGKKVLYKVQIDHFSDRGNAIIYAKKLEQKEKLPYFITITNDFSPPA